MAYTIKNLFTISLLEGLINVKAEYIMAKVFCPKYFCIEVKFLLTLAFVIQHHALFLSSMSNYT